MHNTAYLRNIRCHQREDALLLLCLDKEEDITNFAMLLIF